MYLIKSQMYPISFIEESMSSISSIWLIYLWIAAVHANYILIPCNCIVDKKFWNPIQKQLIAVEKGHVQVKQIDMHICDKK